MTDNKHHEAGTRDLLAQLRRSEAEYRSMINSMTDALHVVDRDLKIVLINQAFLDWHERLGLPKDVLGKVLKEVYDFLPPGIEEEYRMVIETGEPLTTEEVSIVGDEEIATETRKIPVVEDGKVVRVITLLRDVTERKAMEDALRQSEAKFKTLAEGSPNMIFINRMGKIVYVNNKCTELMGYTREEFYSPDFDFFCVAAPDSIRSMAEGYSAFLEGREYHSHETGLVTKSGMKMDCIVAWSVVDYGDGRAMLGVVTDITDRKRIERALRESEEKYRSFVENFHGIAYRGGLDGTPVFFHGAVDKITGYSESELLSGKPAWGEIILPEDRGEIPGVTSTKGLTDAEQSVEREYRIRTKSGRIRWIHQSLRSVCDETGAPIYLQGALYDVTERRSAEETIARERSAFGLIVEAAVKSGGVDEVCDKILGGLASTLGFDCGTVRLYEPEGRMLRLVSSYGFTPTEIERYIRDQHIDAGGYVAALVARTRQSVWCPDVLHSDQLKEYKNRCLEVGVKSMISWPLISTGGDLLGVMHLLGRSPRDIPEEDRTFFRAVGELFVLVLERKQAEQAVQRSEARYKSRFENSPIALWEEDFSGAKRCIDELRRSGISDFATYFRKHPEDVLACADAVKILGANRAAMDLYGTTNLEDFNRVSTANIKAQTLDAFRRGLTLVAEGKTDFDLDYETLTSEGKSRFVRLRWSVAPGCEQSLERVLVSVIDLTERKEAEEVVRRAEMQLRRYSEELEEMVKDRAARIKELERQRTESEKLVATGRMAARIAHEINNPLAGIKNSFLLLRTIMDADHPHYQYADRVQHEIDRIAQIIRKMYDLYSPDPKKRVAVCFNETIRDVVGIMESTFRAAGIEVAVDIPDERIEIDLPVGYLDQVLFNLIQNAVEASSDGDVVTIDVGFERDSVVIHVSDRGCGVPVELRNRIFEPFFTTKGETGAKGLGLGLAVSKGMVEAMGGTISLQDNPDGGTTFTVALPRRGRAKED